MDLSELRLCICRVCNKVGGVGLKKFFAMIFTVSILFYNTSYAKTQKFEINDLTGAFSDKDAWENKNENVKIGDMLISSSSSQAYICNRKYENSDELICFDLKVNDYKDSWIGLLLRADETDKAPWTGNACVLFVIKEDQIELQYYDGLTGGVMTDVVKNPIEAGKTAHIACGVLKNGDAEQTVLFIDGKNVISRYGTASRKSGYFSMLCGKVDFSFEPTAEKREYAVVCNSEISGDVKNGGELSVSYDVLSSNGSDECSVRWYSSDSADVIGGEVSGSAQYVLGESDLDKYITAGVECNECEFFTNPVFFDSAKSYLEENIVMKENWFISYAKGVQQQIDNDFSVAPIQKDDKLYIPIRYVLENSGYEVEWDDMEKKAIAKKDNSVIDVAPDLMYKNRSFAELENLEETLSCNCIYDEATGIIIIGAGNKEIEDSVYKRVLNYMIYGI